MPPARVRRRKGEVDETPPGGNVGWPEGEGPPTPDPADTLRRVVQLHGKAANPWPDRVFLQEIAWVRQDGLTSSLPTFEVLPPGPELRRLRESVEVDAAKVAYVLGVAPSYLANVESGAAVFDDSCMEQEKGQTATAKRFYACIAEWLRANNNPTEQKADNDGNA